MNFGVAHRRHQKLSGCFRVGPVGPWKTPGDYLAGGTFGLVGFGSVVRSLAPSRAHDAVFPVGHPSSGGPTLPTPHSPVARTREAGAGIGISGPAQLPSAPSLASTFSFSASAGVGEKSSAHGPPEPRSRAPRPSGWAETLYGPHATFEGQSR